MSFLRVIVAVLLCTIQPLSSMEPTTSIQIHSNLLEQSVKNVSRPISPNSIFNINKELGAPASVPLLTMSNAKGTRNEAILKLEVAVKQKLSKLKFYDHTILTPFRLFSDQDYSEALNRMIKQLPSFYEPYATTPGGDKGVNERFIQLIIATIGADVKNNTDSFDYSKLQTISPPLYQFGTNGITQPHARVKKKKIKPDLTAWDDYRKRIEIKNKLQLLLKEGGYNGAASIPAIIQSIDKEMMLMEKKPYQP